jgi:hypothetical protein
MIIFGPVTCQAASLAANSKYRRAFSHDFGTPSPIMYLQALHRSTSHHIMS